MFHMLLKTLNKKYLYYFSKESLLNDFLTKHSYKKERRKGMKYAGNISFLFYIYNACEE